MQVKVHDTFKSFLKSSRYYKSMLDFVEKEKDIAPLKENVFRFLNFDLDKLKCIILGMDPYPSTYTLDGKDIPVATGRAFEVANVNKWTDHYRQTSLAVIFKTLYYFKTGKSLDMEMLRKIDENEIKYIYIHDWFDNMESEGVMFLNASLTTKIGHPNSHNDIWSGFMDELIKYIVSYKNTIKWLIWGKNAYDRVSGLVHKNNIIYTCHPATRVNNTFISDCCFKKVKGIDWF